jgi:hypothetical protein
VVDFYQSLISIVALLRRRNEVTSLRLKVGRRKQIEHLCTDWIDGYFFRLHVPLPFPWPGPGPVNYPPAIDNLMSNLHIHTMSYLMRDENAAQQIRTVAEEQMVNAVRNLSKDHEQAKEPRAA